MAIPQSKAELLAALTTEYQKLEAELVSIPEKMTRERTVTGDISVCDIAAYQAGWGKLLIHWYDTGKKGEMPVLPAEGYKWNQLGELAKHFYKTAEKEKYSDLLKQFGAMVIRVRQIIEENSDKQLYQLNTYNWTGDKWPLGRWINVNSSSPYKSARAKIRSWKKAKGLK